MSESNLLKEYLSLIQLLSELLDSTSLKEKDRKTIQEMLSDCKFVSKWLEIGHQPGTSRPVERLAYYQREILVDPFILDSKNRLPNYMSHEVIEENKKILDSLLGLLSVRERECFIMACADGYSYSEVGNFIGISKSSVALYIRRAKKKITEFLGDS